MWEKFQINWNGGSAQDLKNVVSYRINSHGNLTIKFKNGQIWYIPAHAYRALDVKPKKSEES